MAGGLSWVICHEEDHCSLLKTDICGLRWQWTGGGRVRWLTGWQNHPIPPYCPTIRGSIASSPHTGQTPDQRCAKWILADLWVWVTTLQLKYCQQGRGHNGEWKWIVAIRSNCSIHWNYRHSLQLHGGLKVGASNFLRITIPVCSRLCYW